MDKYQIFALIRTGYAIYDGEDIKNSRRIDQSGDAWNYILPNGVIEIKQDINYNVVKYYIKIDGLAVESVRYCGKTYNREAPITSSKPYVLVPVDFSNKVTELVLVYEQVIDPIEIELKFIESDKKIFDDMQKTEKASVKVSTGDTLVNVYYQPCSDDYKRTEVILYNSDNMLMAKYRVEEEMFFKAITGLAYGKYSLLVCQYDANEKLIFESEKQYFEIKSQSQMNHGNF